jgi:malonyl-CoA O-methyltransferase
MVARPSAIDRFHVRRRSDRAAATYASASGLESEVARRMLERFDYLRIQPQRILDCGCGDGRDLPSLHRRFPASTIVGSDISVAMLERAGRPRSAWQWIARGRRAITAGADSASLPFGDGSFDLVWSNMALHWFSDADACLREWRRVLAPGGLAMFTQLGPDSLRELRSAVGDERVHAFADMHDVGDALTSAGFTAPVLDVELLQLTYENADRLFRELRQSGQTQARPDRQRGLTTPATFRAWEFALDSTRREGRLSVTAEVVYGHAWKGAAKKGDGTAGGVSVVRMPAGTRRRQSKTA